MEIEQQLPKEKWKLNTKIKKIFTNKSQQLLNCKYMKNDEKQTYRQQNSPSQHTSETGKEGKPRKSST